MEKIKSKNQGDSWMEISNFDSYSRPDSLVFSVVIIALVTEGTATTVWLKQISTLDVRPQEQAKKALQSFQLLAQLSVMFLAKRDMLFSFLEENAGIS